MSECIGCGLNVWRFVGIMADGKHLYQCRNCHYDIAADPHDMDIQKGD